MSPHTDAGALLKLLQASSCFRGDVCSSLPCACAESLARQAASHGSEGGEALDGTTYSPIGRNADGIEVYKRDARPVDEGARKEIASLLAEFFPGKQSTRNRCADALIARALPKLTAAGESRQIVKQHLSWLFQYVQGMNACNWHDMKMRAERQLEQLSLMLKEPVDSAQAAVTRDKLDIVRTILKMRWPHRTDREVWITAFIDGKSAGVPGKFYFDVNDAFAVANALTLPSAEDKSHD